MKHSIVLFCACTVSCTVSTGGVHVQSHIVFKCEEFHLCTCKIYLIHRREECKYLFRTISHYTLMYYILLWFDINDAFVTNQYIVTVYKDCLFFY